VALALPVLLGEAWARGPSRPDVVLVTVDTLRPDHLGAYGYAAATSPRIDALAARATLFENAISQAPHTVPSVLQIMTSRFSMGLMIPPEDPTLAELLQAQGYQTVAVVENPHFEQQREANGLRRGFDRFWRNGVIARQSLAKQLYKTDTPADAVTAQARRAILARRPGQPLFLWVHYIDPHDPYLPPFDPDMDRLSQWNPSPYTGDVRDTPLYKQSPDAPVPLSDADRQHLVDLYDAEIRYTDRSVGDLFDLLEEQGLFDRALVVLASDHGESLGEHGLWTHGQSCYEPEIRIPLVVKQPRQRQGQRRRESVQAVDIVPTVLDVLGLDASRWRLDGTSLLRPGDQPAFTFWRDWQVVRTPEWKLVQREGSLRLYRVDRDPGESQDLAAQHPEITRSLLQARDEKLRRLGVTTEELAGQSSRAVEELRALGYLGN
jgi:arylsulfatase